MNTGALVHEEVRYERLERARVGRNIWRCRRDGGMAELPAIDRNGFASAVSNAPRRTLGTNRPWKLF